MDDALSDFNHLLGISAVSTTAEEVVIEATPRAEHANAGGIVHGGYLSTLLDTATGRAAHTAVPPGHLCPHASLSVQYVSAAFPGETLRATAHVARAGRRAASAHATIMAGDRLVAQALSTHTVLAPQTGPRPAA